MDLSANPPNVIVILCDDLGYGDVPLYGPSLIDTPNILRMAAEGVTLTDYYAPANICTPSRAGLLTGRYPVRTGLGFEVIMQDDDRGLPLSEVTIARALKPEYATGLFGKWHLGHRGEAWPPTRHGFDAFFGIPYSHDMHPVFLAEAHAPDHTVTTSPVDFPRLQQDFTDRALSFLEQNRDRPSFVLLALSAPHLPSYPNPPHPTDTSAGPYGAVVREIDGIVGRVLDHVRALRAQEETVVIFTSDNGPWFEGSPGWLRDRKGGGAYDGGYRVPFVAWGPGRLSMGARSNAIAMGIDLMPTILAWAGKSPPPWVAIDGRDLRAALSQGATSPHEALILFDNELPIGVRTQRYKYLVSAYYRGFRFPVARIGFEELYDIEADPSENYSVAAVRPEALAELKTRLSAAQAEFAPYRSQDIPPVFKALRAGALRQD